MYILYAFQCEILHCGPRFKQNHEYEKFQFCFYFYLQYALCHTIPLYVFDLSFLK